MTTGPPPSPPRAPARRSVPCTALLPLLAALGTLAPGQDTAATPPAVRALVVGIGDYPEANGWPRLEGAPVDAATMARLLQERFGVAAADVLLLRDAQATRARIEQAFRTHLIDAAGPRTTALFYFAGHGSQVLDDDGDEGADDGLDETICPFDSVLGDGARNDIRDDELNAWFRELNEKAGQVVGIFDSCHSGTVMRGVEDAVARSAPPETGARGAPERARPRDAHQEFRLDPGAPWPGFRQPVFLLACRDDQAALESGLPRRGRFTTALEQALSRARPGDSWRTVHQRIRRLLLRSRGRQDPMVFGDTSRPILLGAFAPPRQDFVILETSGDGVRIGGGLVDGIEKDAVLVLEPEAPGAAGADAPSYLAHVVAAEPTECLATLAEPLGPSGRARLRDHYVARIQEGPPPSFRLRLRLPKTYPGEADPALVTEWLAGTPYFRAADAAGFDWCVEWAEGQGFTVTDEAGAVLLPHPFRPTTTARMLCLDLENLAVYENVRSLENPEGALDAAIDLDVEPGWALPEQPGTFAVHESLWDVGAAGEPLLRFDRVPADAERVPALRMTLTNRHDRRVYWGGYDIRPNLGVVPLAGGRSFPLEPGKADVQVLFVTDEGWSFAGRPVSGLPPERFKLFIAEEERDYSAVSTGGITPPAEMASTAPPATRGGSTAGTHTLDRWLDAAEGVRFRGADPPGRPMPWTTRSFDLSIAPRGAAEEVDDR